jgi:hypothetical protein
MVALEGIAQYYICARIPIEGIILDPSLTKVPEAEGFRDYSGMDYCNQWWQCEILEK